MKISAIDQCGAEIKSLSKEYEDFDNLSFKKNDFTLLKKDREYDLVYSRFTLHSIKFEGEKRVLSWAYSTLKNKGYFCVEVRGEKNEINGKGEKVAGEEGAFIYDEHFRRFINLNNFIQRLKNIGFHIEYAEEKKGFAPYKGEDETYIRVIAKKEQ